MSASNNLNDSWIEIFSHSTSRWAVSICAALGTALILFLFSAGNLRVQAADRSVYDPQRIDAVDLHTSHPAGLAYVPARDELFLVDMSPEATEPRGWNQLICFNRHGDLLRVRTLPVPDLNTVNVAYFEPWQTIFVLETSGSRLIPIQRINQAYGSAHRKFFRPIPLAPLELIEPQGIAFDPTRRRLFIFDAGVPALLRVQSDERSSFAISAALLEKRVMVFPLNFLELSVGRGLALNPLNGRLYILNQEKAVIYALSQNGELLETIDIGGIFLRDPRGMVFAPSADPTDAPNIFNLFIADSGIGLDAVLSGQVVEIHLGSR